MRQPAASISTALDVATGEDVRILRRGSQIWQSWRQANASHRPDLAGLTNDDLHNLSVGVDDAFDIWLGDLDLHNAVLINASLHDVFLGGVNLCGATMQGSAMRWVVLRGANLRGTNLEGARLERVDLRAANVAGARMGQTVIAACDLSTVDGIDAVIHDGASFVDFDTLEITRSGIGGDVARLVRVQQFLEKAGASRAALRWLEEKIELS